MSNTKPAVASATAKPAVPAATTKTEKSVNPARIRDTTSDYLWTVIGLKECPWSEKAVALLKEHDERVKYLELNTEWHRRLIVEVGTRRIPAIFKGAGYFGSYSDLQNYYMCSFVADVEKF